MMLEHDRAVLIEKASFALNEVGQVASKMKKTHPELTARLNDAYITIASMRGILKKQGV